MSAVYRKTAPVVSLRVSTNLLYPPFAELMMPSQSLLDYAAQPGLPERRAGHLTRTASQQSKKALQEQNDGKGLFSQNLSLD